MSWSYEFNKSINLHVPGRISEKDAIRQAETARAILGRLEELPGLILADEVGMGKTFVALAVACSVALGDRDRRPVVVMVPPSLREKWPKDFKLFTEKCLKLNLACKSVENAVDFLKLLDDKPADRVSLIFITHGAMSPQKKMQDRWVKLALIQRALYRRHDTGALKRSLCRYLPDLLRLKSNYHYCEDLWWDLLQSSPDHWLELLRQYDSEPDDGDDPVPEAIVNALGEMDLTDFYNTLNAKMPLRTGPNISERLKEARQAVNQEITNLWDTCIRSLSFKLPLLILDEAHHLKNARTQLASLFHSKEAEADAEELKGPLAEVFERMLFLTATPFQLGHYELCNVLERFRGISWKGQRAPRFGRDGYELDLETIRSRLNAAQESAVRLDAHWGQLKADDLVAEGKIYSVHEIDEWWKVALMGGHLSAKGQVAIDRFNQTRSRMQYAQEILMKYVIRHTRPQTIDFGKLGKKTRRIRHSGRSIIDEAAKNEEELGIDIEGEALLPFLLAARVTALNPDARPVFAEGLASSYSAFLDTRSQRAEKANASAPSSATDEDDEAVTPSASDGHAGWYLEKLDKILGSDSMKAVEAHPKVNATINKTVDLWKNGEKVLVFCHYLATGSILEKGISRAIHQEITHLASTKLGASHEEAGVELERVGELFNKKESPIRRGLDKAVSQILDRAEYQELSGHRESILDVVRRYARTRSFLARYFPLGESRMTEEMAFVALKRTDASGMTLESLLEDFFKFLVEQCGIDERNRYLEALDSIQTTGGQVRLANGGTSNAIRQRLMLTFNTPFYPEILVASMIMAEGVDLHLNCRHVIHHDLCWNPSTLEQRTGRIDRIGAKVERCGLPITVYLPYISATQDEKMYRVVIDRERWFKVVMGEKYRTDVRTTDKMAERLPFPEEAAISLALNLNII